MTRRRISISEAFNFAWPTLRKRFGLFAAILLTIVGAWAVLEIVVIGGQRFGITLWLAVHLVFLSFVAGVELGVLRVSLALYDGKEPLFADTFKQPAMGPRFLAGQAIYFLISTVGLLLFVAPGAYFSARYALFGFCIAAGDGDVMRSFQRSADLSAGVTIHLFSILLALFVLNVLGASLLGLGLFVTLPLSTLMLAAIYRQLSTADLART
jgi:hypothetical protein